MSTLNYLDFLWLEKVGPSATAYLYSLNSGNQIPGVEPEDLLSKQRSIFIDNGTTNILFDANNRFFIELGIFSPPPEEMFINLKRHLWRLNIDAIKAAGAGKRDFHKVADLSDYGWSVLEDLDAESPATMSDCFTQASLSQETIREIYTAFYDQSDLKDQAVLDAQKRIYIDDLKCSLFYALTLEERSRFIPAERRPKTVDAQVVLKEKAPIMAAIYKRRYALPAKIQRFLGSDWDGPDFMAE